VKPTDSATFNVKTGLESAKRSRSDRPRRPNGAINNSLACRRLLDPRADPLADGVSGWSRGPAVDRRRAAVCVNAKRATTIDPRGSLTKFSASYCTCLGGFAITANRSSMTRNEEHKRFEPCPLIRTLETNRGIIRRSRLSRQHISVALHNSISSNVGKFFQIEFGAVVDKLGGFAISI
jgi:hypothetical protein